MPGIAVEVAVILLLLVVNGVFAMSELALVTAKRVRLEQRAEDGDRGARAALELAREPTQFLSTVQVGITLVGVLAGAFGGATLSEELAAAFARVPAVAPYANGLALALVVGAITYLSLILGELVPKRIALGAPERIAALVARPLGVVSRVAGPVVKLLTGSTNFVLRLVGVRAFAEPGITEEEIRALVEQGAESGVVQQAEHQLVERVFRLGDRQVGALMTPRPDVDWVDAADAPAALAAELAEGRRALLLVCRGDVDHVLGFVQAEALLARCLAGEPVDGAALAALARPALFVPESAPAFRLLEQFRQARQHAAVALDEYGGVAGVVTLDDVLAALVGEIPDAEGGPDEAIVRRPDGSWLMDGQTPLADVEAAIDVELADEERPGYQTLGGFVMARLGHVPRAGERFTAAEFAFEVVDMDARRVDRVLVTRAGRGGAAPGAGGGAPA